MTDKDGKEVPPPAPPAPWDASFRYYRLSQLTDDLVDAYRNLWLATESLLDKIEPYPGGAEWRWLKRALAKAGTIIDLAHYLPPNATGDAVEAAYRAFYGQTRNHIFHAKRSRSSTLPHGSEARAELAATHRRLLDFYLELVKVDLGAHRASSGITFPTFLRRIEATAPDVALHATDDGAPFDPDHSAVAPGGGQVVALATRLAPELGHSRMRAFLGTVTAAELGRLTHLSRVAMTVGRDFVGVNSVEGRLTLEGISRLEAALGIRLSNANQPKDTFLT